MANIATTGTNFPDVNIGNKLAVAGNAAFSGTISAGGKVILNATAFDRLTKVCTVNFTGTQLHAGVRSWANPESTPVVVGPIYIDAAGNTAGTATMSVGVQTSATVLSCTLIDAVSVNTTLLINNIDHKGTAGAFARKLAAGSYVTFAEASGDATTALNTANCLICYTVL